MSSKMERRSSGNRIEIGEVNGDDGVCLLMESR